MTLLLQVNTLWALNLENFLYIICKCEDSICMHCDIINRFQYLDLSCLESLAYNNMLMVPIDSI